MNSFEETENISTTKVSEDLESTTNDLENTEWRRNNFMNRGEIDCAQKCR